VAVLTAQSGLHTRAAQRTGAHCRHPPSAARGRVRWARTMQPAEGDIAFAPAALASYPCRQGNFVKVRRRFRGYQAWGC